MIITLNPILAEQRRRDTLRIVEHSVKQEFEDKKKSDPDGLLTVNTDDENEEIGMCMYIIVTQNLF